MESIENKEEKYEKFEQEERIRREKQENKRQEESKKQEKEKNKKLIKVVAIVIVIAALVKPVSNFVSSLVEAAKTTAKLQDMNVVDSKNYQEVENVTTALGTTLENAISIDSGYESVGYVEYKLGGKYKSISLDVIAAEGEDNNVFTAIADDLYELDEKIIHLRDSKAYTAVLNVEDVDILKLKIRNGHIYISNATLYKTDKLKDECLPRSNKTALVEMFRMEDDYYLNLESYYVDYKGEEHADILKGRTGGNDGQDYRWSESYNLSGKYAKISGTIIPNGTRTDQKNIFGKEDNNDGLFEIYLDGNLAYSYVVEPEADSESFEVDVTGANIMQIKYDRIEDGSGYVVSAIFDDVYLEE